MENKKARLLEIIYEIQEMYPELDRLLITDFDNPDRITITSESTLRRIAEEEGLVIEMVEDFYEEDEDIFGLFDDDDESGGTLQWTIN